MTPADLLRQAEEAVGPDPALQAGWLAYALSIALRGLSAGHLRLGLHVPPEPVIKPKPRVEPVE